jgi:protein SCO1/2
MKRLIIAASICLASAFSASAQTAGRPAPPPMPAGVANPHAGHEAGHDNGAPASPATSASSATPAQKYFTDVELVDQDGRKVRFYSDVLKGKTVIVNAFFTTCTSVCPPMNRNMEKIQAALGDRVGRDVLLVSISVDPETDTPARLKEYSQKFHAGAGWLFLTGKKENVDWALYKVGQYVEDKQDHTTVFIVGNEATGLWKKAFGMAKPAELIQIVESVANDNGETKTAGKGETKTADKGGSN